MFPTKGKDKISQNLSYPVHAKVISDALEDVPQTHELTISFSYSSEAKWSQTKKPVAPISSFPVITVEYWNWSPDRFLPQSFSIGPKWKIEVQPVPRAIVTRVKELIIAQALPEMHVWLCARPNLTDEQRSQRLSFLYNDATDELMRKEHP